MMKTECQHLHLDASQPMGNGYIRCADCGRGIPIEHAVGSLETRLSYVEAQLADLMNAVDRILHSQASASTE